MDLEWGRPLPAPERWREPAGLEQGKEPAAREWGRKPAASKRGKELAGLERGRGVSATAGSATVELAAAVPLLVVVTLAMISLLGLARDQVLAQGAAREGAREAAIGGDQARAAAAARAALPPGRAARVVVAAGGSDLVRVSVELPVRLPFGAPLVTIRATAVAAQEPGPSPSPAGP